ncbi:MAG: aminomethyltransferase beta-barrel domain-containing protein [Patescibacteria group bacterium]|nr:aminomethyltransferase beta-barrel domain-containing protein [Patescibacteria group bacterium]
MRHQGKLTPCKLKGNQVILQQSVTGVAPGQVAVIYSGLVCLGGGIIS